MVLKHFKPPVAHYPPELVEKKGYGGWGTCLEGFFGAIPFCVVWKSAIQFTG